MTISRISISLCMLALITACGGPGENATVPQAQPAGATSADIGDYIVHFNAQTTDQLALEVAQAHGIQRSKNRVMLNVTVVRESDGSPVAADITIKTRNLTQQLKTVEMRRIDDQNAIYYIGETSVANRETLIFEIIVQAEGEQRPADAIKFQRQFYTD